MLDIYLYLGSTLISDFISAASTNAINLNIVTDMLLKHIQTMQPI